MSTSLETLCHYVPGLVLRRLAADPETGNRPECQRFPAAVFLADVTGFTALTEQLAAEGPVGAEKLSAMLNDYYDRLVTLIVSHGGDVVKFAGDAVLAVWPATVLEEDLERVTRRAVACGLQAQEQLHEYRTEYGYRLGMRIVLGAGEVILMTVGGVQDRWELLIGGEPFGQVGIAEHEADRGEVVVSPRARELVRDACAGTPVGAGHVRVEKVLSPLTPRAFPAVLPPPSAAPAVGAFIAGAVRARLAAGMKDWLAELRPVSVIFVNLPALDLTRPDSLDQAQQLMVALQETVYYYEGSINKLSADEKGVTLVAAMGLPPLTHEDDPRRAVAAALAIRRRLGELQMRCGIGVTTGRVYCGEVGGSRRREYTIMGDVVNLAARLMMAAPESVLCDSATYEAAKNRIRFEVLPPIRVKGKEHPVPVFRPLDDDGSSPRRPSSAVSSPASPIQGRTAEREELARALEALLAFRSGQPDAPPPGVVVIEGEAGIGKSRLVEDLLERAAARGVTCLVGEGDPIEHATPYHGWRPIFSELLGVEDVADPDRRREQVLARLQPEPGLLRLAPLLDAVLPLDLDENELTSQMTGQVRADNTQDLLIRLLRSAAENAPTVLVLDDAHWLDSSSWALALLTARQVPEVLLVVSTRPLPEPAPPEYALLRALPVYRDILLVGLPPESVEALVCQRLGVDEIPAPVTSLILEKAQGNPFFSEQLALALHDSGTLTVQGRRCTLAPQLDWRSVTLPDSIQGAVVARIDRLSPSLQLVIKVASVIGRVFAFLLLRDIYPRDPDMSATIQRGRLADYLSELEERQITAREAPEPDLVYLFKHAITQEVAYNLMTFAQRRQLHGAVAEWYEQVHADDLEAQYSLLAHHWSKAEVEEKALDYLARAGTQALREGAYQEAVELLTEALNREVRADNRRDTLWRAGCQRRLGEAHQSLGHLAESRQWLEESATTLGFPPPRSAARLTLTLAGQLAVQLWHRLRARRYPGPPRALPSEGPAAERAVRFLEAARTYERLLEIYYLATETGQLFNAMLRVINLTERVGPCPELARAYAVGSVIVGCVPLHRLARSYAAGGLRTAEQVAEESGVSLPVQSWVLEMTSVYGVGVADWKPVNESLERAIAMYDELGDRPHHGQSLAILAQTAYLQGEFERGVKLWQQVADEAKPHNNKLLRAWGRNGLAEGLLRQGGDVATAVRYLEEALELFADNIDRVSETTTHGMLAVARLRLGDRSAARLSAEAGAALIAGSGRPGSYYELGGYAGVAEVFLALWETGDATAERPARKACAELKRYARVFPFALPRACLFRGILYHLDGRPRRARRMWKPGLRASREKAMPYDEGLLLCEMGRRLPVADPDRRPLLEQAVAIFTRLGTPYELARARAALG